MRHGLACDFTAKRPQRFPDNLQKTEKFHTELSAIRRRNSVAALPAVVKPGRVCFRNRASWRLVLRCNALIYSIFKSTPQRSPTSSFPDLPPLHLPSPPQTRGKLPLSAHCTRMSSAAPPQDAPRFLFSILKGQASQLPCSTRIQKNFPLHVKKNSCRLSFPLGSNDCFHFLSCYCTL